MMLMMFDADTDDDDRYQKSPGAPNKAHLITAPSAMAAWTQQQSMVSVLDATCFLEFKSVGCMSIAQDDADVDSSNTKSWLERS